MQKSRLKRKSFLKSSSIGELSSASDGEDSLKVDHAPDKFPESGVVASSDSEDNDQ